MLVEGCEGAEAPREDFGLSQPKDQEEEVSSSPSSSSSASKKFLEGLLGRSVSDDGEGDSVAALQPLPNT